jgi:hypothetical protein
MVMYSFRLEHVQLARIGAERIPFNRYFHEIQRTQLLFRGPVELVKHLSMPSDSARFEIDAAC